MHRRVDAAAGLLMRLNDPGNRLPGENPQTANLDDARRWAETYDRLVAFKRELLEHCQTCADQSEPAVARAIRETDMVLLEMQSSRFAQKRDYWKIRATELAGNGRHRSAG